MLDQKSEANLEIAKLCFEKEAESFYSVGVSRAYYAIFQSVKFLLVKNDFDYKLFKKKDPIAKKQMDYAHGAIRRALVYFLRTSGFNSQEDLKFIDDSYTTFNRLYKWRLEGDYEEIVISKEVLGEAIEKAEKFINELKKYNIQ